MVRAERTRAMHHRIYGSVRASEARRQKKERIRIWWRFGKI